MVHVSNRTAERTMGPGRDLGLGHRDHPLLGHTVVDTATGRIGILRAICPEPTDSEAYLKAALKPGDGPLRAWMSPLGGGPEWTTDLAAIQHKLPLARWSSPTDRTGPDR